MSYFGGHVQVAPKIYLVFWGWGQPGAFDHTTTGLPSNDPDGAAARMTSFIKAIGGTPPGGGRTPDYQAGNREDGHNTKPPNPRRGARDAQNQPLHTTMR